MVWYKWVYFGWCEELCQVPSIVSMCPSDASDLVLALVPSCALLLTTSSDRYQSCQSFQHEHYYTHHSLDSVHCLHIILQLEILLEGADFIDFYLSIDWICEERSWIESRLKMKKVFLLLDITIICLWTDVDIKSPNSPLPLLYCEFEKPGIRIFNTGCP